MEFLSHILSAVQTLFCGTQRKAIPVAMASMYRALAMNRPLC